MIASTPRTARRPRHLFDGSSQPPSTTSCRAAGRGGPPGFCPGLRTCRSPGRRPESPGTRSAAVRACSKQLSAHRERMGGIGWGSSGGSDFNRATSVLGHRGGATPFWRASCRSARGNQRAVRDGRRGHLEGPGPSVYSPSDGIVDRTHVTSVAARAGNGVYGPTGLDAEGSRREGVEPSWCGGRRVRASVDREVWRGDGRQQRLSFVLPTGAQRRLSRDTGPAPGPRSLRPGLRVRLEQELKQRATNGSAP